MSQQISSEVHWKVPKLACIDPCEDFFETRFCRKRGAQIGKTILFSYIPELLLLFEVLLALLRTVMPPSWT